MTIDKSPTIAKNQREYDLGGAMQVVGAATQQVASGLGELNAVSDKAKAAENAADAAVTNPTSASSTSDLLNQWSSWNPTAHISYKDLLSGNTVGNMISGAGSGAMAGANFGGIGAGIGAAAGLITGGLFGWAAKAKAKRKARAINKRIDAQNLSTRRAFTNQAEQLDDEMVANELSDFTGWAAYGGPLRFADGGNLFADGGDKNVLQRTWDDIVSLGDAIATGVPSWFRNQKKEVDRELSTPTVIDDALGISYRTNPLIPKKPAKRFEVYKGPREDKPQKGKKKAFGGELNTNGGDFTNGLLFIDSGGTHEQNPYDGVPMGMDEQGTPNLVEEGEVIFKDYVFSDRMKVPSAIRDKYKLRGTKPLTFADAVKKLSKESEERPNDPISINGLESILGDLMSVQEELRARKTKRQMERRFDWGGFTTDYANQLKFRFPGMDQATRDKMALEDIRRNIDKPLKLPEFNPTFNTNLKPNTIKTETSFGTIETPTIGMRYEAPWEKPMYSLDFGATTDKGKKGGKDKKGASMDLLRFAPAVGQGIQTLTDALGLTNSPDFTLGKKIREANSQVRGVGTRAAGQRMGYKPTDMWAAINNFNAQMSAQRSALRNSGNRVGVAGQLLASAYNQNRALGELYAGMEEASWDRLTQAIAHNTSVDQANRNAELEAARADAAQGNIRAQNLITAAKADDAEETAYAQARATNRDNFFNTLGALGKEKIDRSMMKGLIESGVFGTPNEAMLEALNYLGVNPKTTKKAKGGKINRKKRGLTY